MKKLTLLILILTEQLKTLWYHLIPKGKNEQSQGLHRWVFDSPCLKDMYTGRLWYLPWTQVSLFFSLTRVHLIRNKLKSLFFRVAVNRGVREKGMIFPKRLPPSLTLPQTVGRFTGVLVLLTLDTRSWMLPLHILLLLRLDFAADAQL